MASCRFYSSLHPEVDEVVVARVHTIAKMGAYVHLLEYNNMEGMILMSELSRRRIRSVNKLIRIGRTECVTVTRVDAEKHYIDLSKCRVTEEEKKMCEQRYARAKAVYGILQNVARNLNMTTSEELEELFKNTAWHFDDKMKKRTGAYDVFKLVVSDPSLLDECNITQEVKDELCSVISSKLSKSDVNIRADIEVTCFDYFGIDGIKSALTAGMNCSTEDVDIKIRVIAAPSYVLTATANDKALGMAVVTEALKIIKSEIESYNGTFKIASLPRMVAEKDSDTELLRASDKKDKIEDIDKETDDQVDDIDDAEEAVNHEDLLFNHIASGIGDIELGEVVTVLKIAKNP